MNCIHFVEIWKPVIYPGVKLDLYQVSSYGRVINNKGYILAPILHENGYYVYHLFSGEKGKYKTVLIHRLVMMTFCPISDPNNYTVDHLNGDKSNYKIWNLEWVTQLENNMRSHNINQNYNFGITHYMSKLSEDEVHLICRMLKENYKFKDIIEALGKDPKIDENYFDIIGTIKRHITYKDISCNYNF